MSRPVARRADLLKSSRLIEEWKAQIAVMKEEIERAEKQHELNVVEWVSDFEEVERRLRSSLEEEISALRQECDAKVKSSEEALAESTRDVHACLQETQHRLDIEHIFLSNVRKIPPEVMTEILEWYLEGATPTQGLAMVCKAWKRLLLDAPFLWRKIEAYCIHPAAPVEWHIQRLLRRIELSKATLLDVTMSHINRYGDCNRFDLFHIIFQTSKDRWRSLKLQSEWSMNSTQPFESYLCEGSFNALKVLDLGSLATGGGETSPFYNLIAAIAQSRAPLDHLLLPSELPTTLRGSPILRHIRKLTASRNTVGSLSNLNHLQDLEILTFHSPFNPFDPASNNPAIDPIPLPKKTTIQDHITLSDFRYMRFHAVESLQLMSLVSIDNKAYYQDPSVVLPIEFPQLMALTVEGGNGLLSLRHLHMPRLTTLSLTRSFHVAKEAKEHSQSVLDYFQAAQNGDFVLARPTSLYMDLSLSPKALIVAFQYWSQLQDVTLAFGKEFNWTGLFASALSRRKNPLCPELVTLRLHPKGSITEDWRKVANQVLDARAGTPFRTIIWKEYGYVDRVER